ncbi:MAG: hypothetical protein Q8R18_00405 [bacterium]|nr:hypothetical protein [bacterium]
MEQNEQTIHKSKRKSLMLWQISTAILAISLIAAVMTSGFKFANEEILSGDVVADKTVQYINENMLNGQAQATIESIEESEGLYLLKLDVNGQEFDSYVTKDGTKLFTQAINIDEPLETNSATSQTQEITTSETPNVELFIMSYCPYGTQVEKGIIPVVKALGSTIDFEVKFVNYAMHPSSGEVEENLRQYCIQQEYKEKYLTYLSKFLEASSYEDALAAADLTTEDISVCIEETDAKFDVTKNLEDKSSWSSGRFPKFLVHDAENKQYAIQGSPTLVINGEQVESGRDAASLLNTICGAFVNQPSACDTDLTSFGTPAPGFGFDTQGGSATAAGCGV